MTDSLELSYLGRLTARVEAGRVPGRDPAFVYASEPFLGYHAWPAYTRICTNNAVAALLLAMGRFDEACGARLVIFRAGNWMRARALVVVNGDLIAWEPGDTSDAVRIRSERKHAKAMLAVIRQAEASYGDV